MSRIRLNRRAVLAGALASAAVPGLLSSRSAHAQDLGGLRGALDATHEGLVPGAPHDQTGLLAEALLKAEANNQPLFLPPGRYEIARLDLPVHAQILGVAGESRLVFRGDSYLLRARQSRILRLHGIVLDGAGLPLGDGVAGLLDADGVDDLVIDDCIVVGSAVAGASLRACAGRVERSRFAGARTVGLHLWQSRSMAAVDNLVSECGDTGILVNRDEESGDDTILRGNRVTAIRAQSGGTGQYGNGINIAQANGVLVQGNRIDDCDFSAIRCFSSDNVHIADNVATRSGEMAIYVEFAFEGALVSNNLIDGAAFGISFANLYEYGGRLAVCSGNLVRNISGVSRLPRGENLVGTGIGAEADIAITGNVIENAERGLQLGWGPYLRDVTATGNVIRDVSVGVVVSVADGAGAALISDNLISGAERGAIVGMRWGEVATGDLAAGGAEQFPHLTVEGNQVS